MRRRAIVGVMAVLAASALVVGMSVSIAGASVGSAKPPPLCAGKTKAAAVKAIKKSYDYFLNGSLGYTAAQKAPYIQYLSGKNLDQALLDQFTTSSEANAAAASTTAVDVDKVICAKKGKKATVNFTLVISGGRLEGLAPPGAAVLDGKNWKVTALTLCNLQALGDPSVLENPPCSDIVLKG
jgi:hypothetical protein